MNNYFVMWNCILYTVNLSLKNIKKYMRNWVYVINLQACNIKALLKFSGFLKGLCFQDTCFKMMQ